MNGVPKISVIVPMYNAEKYLSTCVNSILTQTFKDFELILIDDFSTDRTLQIAGSFKDPRVKIARLRQNLGNPGAVRNIGLNFARGEFVYFMDNDDAIMQNAFAILIDAMNKTNADIVYSCRWLVADNPEFTSLDNLPLHMNATSSEPVSKDLKTRILQELCEHHMHSVAWLCLYRRTIFENPNGKIRFPNALAEDVFVHFDLLCATDKIVKITNPFYIYRDRKDSLTHSGKNISKALASIFYLNNYVRNKLLALTNDKNFVNNVCLTLMNGVSSTYLLPAFQENSLDASKDIEEFFNKYFEHDANSLAQLLFNYLWFQDKTVKYLKTRSMLQDMLDDPTLV